MSIPHAGRYVVFSAITSTTTQDFGTIAVDGDGSFPVFAKSLLLEIVGSSTPNWSLSIEGRTHPSGTFTKLDYVEAWKAGAAAVSNSALVVNDTTRRFYHIPNAPPYVQIIATRTGGTLTVHAHHHASPIAQWLLTTARGSVYIEGPTASDAAEAGNPVQIGASVDITSPTAAAEGDVRRMVVTPKGALAIAQAMSIVNTGDAQANNQQMSFRREDDTEQTATIGAWLRGFAPDSSWDRVRLLGDAAGTGLGVLAAAPWIPGASDVKTIRKGTATDSTARVTALTPTSGKKIRIISIQGISESATGARFEVYFGTGTTITTTAGNEICEPFLDVADNPDEFIGWPDGGGPIGDADEVVSLRTGSDVSSSGILLIAYREE
jgi:hypothetical protein